MTIVIFILKVRISVPNRTTLLQQKDTYNAFHSGLLMHLFSTVNLSITARVTESERSDKDTFQSLSVYAWKNAGHQAFVLNQRDTVHYNTQPNAHFWPQGLVWHIVIPISITHSKEKYTEKLLWWYHHL